MRHDSLDDTHLLYGLILKAESILRKCLGSDKGENYYYQYTKMKSFEAMINSGSMWATNMKYLNDYLEFQLGIKTVENLFSSYSDMMSREILKDLSDFKKEYENDVFSTFSVSFCEEGDLLSQWITYAKEGGISVGFDFSDESLYWGQKIDAEYYRTNIMKDPMKLMYVPHNSPDSLSDVYTNRIMAFINEIKLQKKGGMKTDIEKLAFEMILCYIKNDHFIQEKEHRIVSVPCINLLSCADEKKYSSEIKTALQESHVFRPYIVLYPITEDNKAAKLPIAELIVGPASNQNNIYKSLVYKLEHSYTEDIKIEIPKPEIMKKRKKRYEQLIEEMKMDPAKKDKIDEKIHFCEKWGLIIRISESSYVF